MSSCRLDICDVWRDEAGLAGAVMLHMGMPRCKVLLCLDHVVMHLTCGTLLGLNAKRERRLSRSWNYGRKRLEYVSYFGLVLCAHVFK